MKQILDNEKLHEKSCGKLMFYSKYFSMVLSKDNIPVAELY
jgi:hypothetical protein